jgi:hypothetical protein
MKSKSVLLKKLKENPNNVRFRELCEVCDHYFGPPRTKTGSHRVHQMPWQGDPRVNIQNSRGMAKVYQIKQVLRAIEKLESEDDSNK